MNMRLGLLWMLKDVSVGGLFEGIRSPAEWFEELDSPTITASTTKMLIASGSLTGEDDVVEELEESRPLPLPFVPIGILFCLLKTSCNPVSMSDAPPTSGILKLGPPEFYIELFSEAAIATLKSDLSDAERG